MRVWTNGKRHLVAGPRGLAIYDGAKAPSIRSLDGVGGHLAEPTSTKERGAAGGWQARDALAVAPGGDVAWVARDGAAYAVPLAARPSTAATLAWKFGDLALTSEGRVLAVVYEGGEDDESARIVLGNMPDEGGAWDAALAIPEPVRVKWPNAIWTKEATPWSKQKTLGTESAHVVTNAFGTVVADKDTGMVLVLRPGSKAFDFALRVPSTYESQVYGAATREGVLVVICVEGRESCVCHFTPAGDVLAHHDKLGGEACFGMIPAAVVDPTSALVYSDETLHVLGLPGLDPIATVELAGDHDGEPSIFAAPDGKTCLFGFGAQAWIATRTKKVWTAEPLPEAEAHPRVKPAPKPLPAAPAAKSASPSMGAPRVSGEPVLQLVPSRDAPRIWTATAGETLTVDVTFGSVGGRGTGIAIEISGGLVQGEKLKPRAVKLAGKSFDLLPVAGGRTRVEIKDVALPAGLVAAPDAKSKLPTSELTFTAQVTLDATAAAGDLLTIRVSPLSAKSPGAGSFGYSKRVEIAG
jgi:hypothetical protein